MRKTPNSRSYFASSVALALASFLVLFLVQVVIHGHDKGQNEAACWICHASHVGSGPDVNAFLLSAPLLPDGRAHTGDVAFHIELFFHDSPSRAPPAA
jgi:hypothetical protein